MHNLLQKYEKCFFLQNECENNYRKKIKIRVFDREMIFEMMKIELI